MTLAVRNAYFSYTSGQENILADVSFDVQKNEIVGIVGASGCGKSTLLRLIAGLLPVEPGMIEKDHSANCSYVFQEPALMPWATVMENVALPLKLQGIKDNKAVRRALDMVDMTGYAFRYPAHLSGGQQMRVSIARALASRSTLLLLDEPFAALDELLRFQMNELVLKLRADMQLSVVFVTHSIYEACYLADKVLVMANGRLAGVICPTLDKNLPPLEQRSSPAFMSAVKTVSKMLAEAAV